MKEKYQSLLFVHLEIKLQSKILYLICNLQELKVNESQTGFELPCLNQLIRYASILLVIKVPMENDMVYFINTT